jgi:hypothetical protein
MPAPLSARSLAGRAGATVLCATALTAALATPALAARPTVDTVDRTFVNGFLSEQCGVEVTQHLWGSYLVIDKGGRTFTQFRFRSTLTAGANTVGSRSFGPTVEELAPDGTLTITRMGVNMRNLPGSGAAGPFAGRSVTVITFDEDGEIASETTTADSGFREDLVELCAALTR